MSDLGGARQDISRHRRAAESVVRQRKGVSGYGAPQIELHKLDARGRRRHRDWSHPGKSRAPAGLISCASLAAFRGVLSIVDAEAADDFGFRGNADPDRRCGCRSDASPLSAALMCVFHSKWIPRIRGI